MAEFLAVKQMPTAAMVGDVNSVFVRGQNAVTGALSRGKPAMTAPPAVRCAP
jgi:hypothetical protein